MKSCKINWHTQANSDNRFGTQTICIDGRFTPVHFLFSSNNTVLKPEKRNHCEMTAQPLNDQ